MQQPQPAEFTRLLTAYRQGHAESGEQLFALVYQELRRLAQQYLKSERAGHTLQATALVHEAWLRLFGTGIIEVENRKHFFVIAARQMRRILIDYARAAKSERRGGNQTKVTLDDAAHLATHPKEDLVALDAALTRLEALCPRASQVVELRYFAGLTEPETAEALQISVSAVKRDWVFARVWLLQQVNGTSQSLPHAKKDE